MGRLKIDFQTLFASNRPSTRCFSLKVFEFRPNRWPGRRVYTVYSFKRVVRFLPARIFLCFYNVKNHIPCRVRVTHRVNTKINDSERVKNSVTKGENNEITPRYGHLKHVIAERIHTFGRNFYVFGGNFFKAVGITNVAATLNKIPARRLPIRVVIPNCRVERQ